MVQVGLSIGACAPTRLMSPGQAIETKGDGFAMTSRSEFKSVKVYVPVGSLGVGIFPEEVEVAMAKRPDVMAMDAGSTDSGAAYLAKGISKNNRGAVKADLLLLMGAQHKHN